MPEEINPYQGQLLGDVNARIRNLEEKQRILKDRLLLIGQNLIEMRERSNERTLEIKKDIEIPYPYHATVKKIVSSTATSYWRTVIAGLLQAKKIEKDLETAKVRALKHFNEILFR